VNSEAQLNPLLDEKLPFSPSAETMAAARAEVRELGKRATPARLTTLLFLRSQSRPVSHAEVAKGLESLGFDKATVFRNLNDLCEWGLAQKSELGDHVWRFETSRSGSHRSKHPHFVCVDCGTVTCMQQIQLTRGSLETSRDIGQVTEILLRGHCNDCR